MAGEEKTAKAAAKNKRYVFNFIKNSFISDAESGGWFNSLLFKCEDKGISATLC
jgi:hypothetical protein